LCDLVVEVVKKPGALGLAVCGEDPDLPLVGDFQIFAGLVLTVFYLLRK
jgi:hypothetical protein